MHGHPVIGWDDPLGRGLPQNLQARPAGCHGVTAHFVREGCTTSFCLSRRRLTVVLAPSLKGQADTIDMPHDRGDRGPRTDKGAGYHLRLWTTEPPHAAGGCPCNR